MSNKSNITKKKLLVFAVNNTDLKYFQQKNI